MCEKDCKISDCERRHPKICIYLRRFGRCKFTTYCSYDHAKSSDILENSEKISKLEQEVEILKEINDKIEVPDKSLEERVNAKLECLESKIDAFKMALDDKDDQIKKMEKEFKHSMKRCEEKFREEISKKDSKLDYLEKQLKNLENKFAENLEKVQKIEKEDLKCSKCDFISQSKQGLKTHIKRKHTNADTEVYPKTCDMCDFELKSFKEMKKHMKSHSYQELNFKCENCDFWGPNKFTMEVHFGRNHSEIFECGLCEWKNKSLEKLEMHLNTREIYQCEYCDVICNKLSDMKTHKEEKHAIGYFEIIHAKLDRKNNELVTLENYICADMF